MAKSRWIDKAFAWQCGCWLASHLPWTGPTAAAPIRDHKHAPAKRNERQVTKGKELEASWWEELATALLPWMQKAIIDALRATDQPLTEAELLLDIDEATGRVGKNIKHHLRRLKGLNAIELVVGDNGKGPVRYRLTERPGRRGDERG